MARQPLLAAAVLPMLMMVVFGSVSSGDQNSHKDFVDTHNEFRSEVGVGPIVWNDTVAAYAQKYANDRIHDCNLDHSGGPYGENLAEGYGEMTAVEAVRFWGTEKTDYDDHANKCKGGEESCLHYTQMVWRKSVHLGCARVKCNNGWVFVICNYEPPGNYEGERPY